MSQDIREFESHRFRRPPLFANAARALFLMETRLGLRQHSLRVMARALEFLVNRACRRWIVLHREIPSVLDGEDFLVLGCPRGEQRHRVGRGQCLGSCLTRRVLISSSPAGKRDIVAFSRDAGQAESVCA